MLFSQDDKSKLEAARTLIKQKDFDLAARILRTMDHPTAKEWLAEIEASQARKRKREYPLRLIAIILLIIIVALVGAGGIFQGNDPRQGIVSVPTQAALDTSTPSTTPTATDTPSITPTPTDTFTPSATSTDTPSATDTSTATYTPSMTITFTLTPAPTHTLEASATPVTLHETEPKLYDVTVGQATFYACPRMDCKVVSKLTQGDTIMVVGDIQGEAVVANSRWFFGYVGDKRGYINSLFVDAQRDLNSTPAPPTEETFGG